MSETNLFDAEDKQVLAKTAKLRGEIITQLTATGIPKDEKDRKFLLDVLDSSDKAVFNKTRIKVDEKNGQNQQQTTAMIAAVLLKINEQQIVANTQAALARALPKDITVENPVPGETNIGVENQTYDQFMSRMTD